MLMLLVVVGGSVDAMGSVGVGLLVWVVLVGMVRRWRVVVGKIRGMAMALAGMVVVGVVGGGVVQVAVRVAVGCVVMLVGGSGSGGGRGRCGGSGSDCGGKRGVRVWPGTVVGEVVRVMGKEEGCLW